MRQIAYLFCAPLLLAATVHADHIVINASGQGWISCNGGGFFDTGSDVGSGCDPAATANNGDSANNGNMAGLFHGLNEDVAYRDFYQFAVPALPGPIVSANLSFSVESDNTLTYQISAIPAVFSFDDLGTGAIYGTREFTTADNGQTESIALGAAALADIESAQGGTFGIGGRVLPIGISGDFLAPDALVSSETPQLQITATPEPAFFPLIAGLLAAALLIRLRSAAE